MFGMKIQCKSLACGLLNVCAFLVCMFFPSKGYPSEEPILRVLDNGMTVVLQENHSAPVVSIQAWVNAGSTQERAREYGMAHVLEHMVFKGTESRGVGAVAQEVEAAGGMINAYTSWSTTVYYVNMASRFMDKGIDILADITQSATFDPQELAKEKQVVLEEIRRGKDMPGKMISEAFFEKAYAVHPYGRPVIGFEKNVRSFTREDLLAFYRKWYVPENMVWVMAGDLNPEELLPKLEQRLGKMPARRPPLLIRTEEPPQTEPRVLILKEEVAESHLKMGFHIPGISHPDVPALDLLAQILGQGNSSRLYRAFRLKKRLVNSVYAYSLTPRDAGLFLVGASLEAQDMNKAVSGILEEVLRIGFEPVDPEELKTAKALIESDFIYQMETVQGQARELGYYQVAVGDLDFGKQYLQRLRAVRSEDLLRVARTYFRPNNLTLAVLVPKSAEESFSEQALLKGAEKSYKDLESSLLEDETQRDGTGKDAVFETRLPNGALLLVKENRGVPLVSIKAVFLGGLLSENKETDGISNFTARMLTKGTRTRTADQISQGIESLGGSVYGFSGRNSFGLTSSVVSWNFLPAFEIFSDVLLHPEFPEEHVEKIRKDILAAIKNKEDNLAHLAFQLFWKNLYPCHPYGMEMPGTPETINRISRNDLVDYYRREAVAPNLVLAVVGDVDSREVTESAERLLEGLSNKAFELPSPLCNEEPKKEAIKRVSPDKLQAHILVGARGTSFSDRERFSLDVLQAVLAGQGGRLFMNLRDRQSLAYTVTAFNQDAYDPGAFGLYIATKPENFQKALEGIHRELNRVREEKIPKDELARAKNYLVGSYDLSIQTNAAQASLMASFERYGLGYSAYQLYPKHIQAVTARDVQKAARKYLCPDCLVEAVVIPEGNPSHP